MWARIMAEGSAVARAPPWLLLHQHAGLGDELVEALLRRRRAAHHRVDDLTLRAPDADRVAAGVTLPRRRALGLPGHGPEVRVCLVEGAGELRSGRAQVGWQVAGRLDDDLLRLGAGDELDELPGRLLLCRVARGDDGGVAAGRQRASFLVVDREGGGAEHEFVTDEVGHLAHPGRRVEEDADLAGNELLARLVPVDQRHAAIGDHLAEGLERLEPDRAAEGDLRLALV